MVIRRLHPKGKIEPIRPTIMREIKTIRKVKGLNFGLQVHKLAGNAVLAVTSL